MLLRLAFAASVEKSGNAPHENEDSYGFDSEEGTKRFAVSDGAAQSYDARTFSRVVCEQWLRRPVPVAPLRSAQRAYDSRFRGVQLSWSDAAGLELGSFATLLGGSVHGSTLSVTVIGDSLLVYLPPNEWEVRTIPYVSAAEFEQSPLLLSTRREKMRGFSLAYLRTCKHEIPLQVGAKIVCVTDALGGWYLAASPEQRHDFVTTIRSEPQFRDLINAERERRTLKNDDSTMLVFDVVERIPPE